MVSQGPRIGIRAFSLFEPLPNPDLREPTSRRLGLQSSATVIRTDPTSLLGNSKSPYGVILDLHSKPSSSAFSVHDSLRIRDILDPLLDPEWISGSELNRRIRTRNSLPEFALITPLLRLLQEINRKSQFMIGPINATRLDNHLNGFYFKSLKPSPRPPASLANMETVSVILTYKNLQVFYNLRMIYLVLCQRFVSLFLLQPLLSQLDPRSFECLNCVYNYFGISFILIYFTTSYSRVQASIESYESKQWCRHPIQSFQFRLERMIRFQGCINLYGIDAPIETIAKIGSSPRRRCPRNFERKNTMAGKMMLHP
ncbi:hypothetical protein VNO77_42369 [Canavalia gladiata]|uniref:Uncharacterized protein n=1 Tax=Canavalia gladiata TaxID=3824 RepID=A0AAN9K2J3_CANGL